MKLKLETPSSSLVNKEIGKELYCCEDEIYGSGSILSLDK